MTIGNLYKGSSLIIKVFVITITLFSVSTVNGQIANPKDSTKKVKFAGIPMINYNTSFGFMAGGIGSMLYKLNSKDTISPSSSTTLIGIYSSSKTYFAAAVQKMYFKEDTWRADLIFGTGDVFFQFYTAGQGQVFQDGQWIDFNTKVNFLQISLKRKVFSDFYAGLEGTLNSSSTVYGITNPITGEDITSISNLNSIGYNLLYDTRDNVNFPTFGFFINFKNNFVREAFNATSEFDRFELGANYFWDMKKNSKSILVSRIYTNIAAGDVPFEGQNFIGQDDLRGYSKGQFRGNQVYTAQVELRQNIHKKFGMVGFLGVGMAVNEFSDVPNAELAPSIGLGARYLMIPSEKMNIGCDVGVGKDDWSLTFRIGETFGR